MNTSVKSIWRSGVTLDLLRAQSPDTMLEHLGIELTELGPDFLRGAMPVTSRTCQPMRILHGGASVAFAESLASIAASASLRGESNACVGQEINANHLRPAPIGVLLTGTTRPFHIGARSQVWGIEIVNESNQLVCVSRITIAVIDRPERFKK